MHRRLVQFSQYNHNIHWTYLLDTKYGPDLLERLLQVVCLGGHALQLCRVQLTQLVLVLAQRPLLTVQRLNKKKLSVGA